MVRRIKSRIALEARLQSHVLSQHVVSTLFGKQRLVFFYITREHVCFFFLCVTSLEKTQHLNEIQKDTAM